MLPRTGPDDAELQRLGPRFVAGLVGCAYDRAVAGRSQLPRADATAERDHVPSSLARSRERADPDVAGAPLGPTQLPRRLPAALALPPPGGSAADDDPHGRRLAERVAELGAARSTPGTRGHRR